MASAIILVAFLTGALSGCIVVHTDNPSTAPPPVAPPGETTSPPAEPPPAPEDPNPEPPKTWTSIVASTRSGVAHLSAGQCDGYGGTGTGFYIGDNLIITASHVVRDASEAYVRLQDQYVAAELLGVDHNREIALLRTLRDVDGHEFSFASDNPSHGDEIGIMGFPRNSDVEDAVKSDNAFQFNYGRLSGFGRTLGEGQYALTGLMQFDASTNPGNSGGPLINLDGEIVGLHYGSNKYEGEPGDDDFRIVSGEAFAVPTAEIRPLVEVWKARNEVVAFDTCSGNDSSEFAIINVFNYSEHPLAEELTELLGSHGELINYGYYESAFKNLSSDLQERSGGLEQWTAGHISTFWTDIFVFDITHEDSTATASVVLVTQQDEQFSPTDTTGQTCSVWILEYGLIHEGFGWKIDSAHLPITPEACDSE
ncbi:serine protease [Glutamicibacter sp. MNS18]|uniref:S1C family serine protease n=1 Tax=Glutamicibacter sp. MNS18 TaxID=2989817 RepID=UPI0022357E1E|nr:serine protease [Glutamicibacter sp. MNS18]MCW4464439.1 serine protease [Glutamicibacter sp. MNS18]